MNRFRYPKRASKLNRTQILQALTVEVIRRLWDRGLYRANPWLRKVHTNWFDVWVEWRTEITMRSVDRQANAIVADWDRQEAEGRRPVFSQVLEGETPLGGEMRLTRADLDLERPPSAD